MVWKKVHKNKKTTSAFSLIELSIVILIIGILIAGVTQGSRLVAQMRLATAKSITRSAPVSSIRNLVTWLETTSDASLDDAAREDGTAISSGAGYSWYDINPQTSTKNNVASTTGPTYKSSCINGLPCLQFNGTSHYLNSTQNLGTTTELTVFIVFNPSSIGTLQDFIVTRGAFAANDNSFTYAVQNGVNKAYYRSTNTGAVNSYVANVLTANTNYITDFVDNNVTTVHYQNGLSNSSNVVNGLKSLNIFTVGAWDNAGSKTEFFGGNMGEIIIFDRALKNEERYSIEKYLGQKWGIKIP